MGNFDEESAHEQLETALNEIDIKQYEEQAAKEKGKDEEDYNKRAASSTILINFGKTLDEARDHHVGFSTVGQVNSLLHAYVMTCHKSQGSEYSTVIVALHSSNHMLLVREWLYTAVTRAQHRVVLLCNKKGLSMCLNRQRVKGANLEEKVLAYQKWQEEADKSNRWKDKLSAEPIVRDPYADTRIPVLPEPKKLED